jgi:hypothetical protein
MDEVGGAAEPARCDKCLVVVVGERNQSRVTLHALTVTASSCARAKAFETVAPDHQRAPDAPLARHVLSYAGVHASP